MTHQNQYLRRIGTRFQQYESKIQAAIAKSVEADVSARRLEADSGIAFYQEFDRIASELKASGITIAQWCRQLNIADVRTYQRRKRLHIQFDKYAKIRRRLGDCGRTGFAFALELISTPSGDNIVTHPSAGGTKRQFIMTNGSPVIRVVERDPAHHEGNFPTPRFLYDWIAEKWGPSDLDVCADRQSAKAKRWFSKEQDGLKQDWRCHRAFMNHPYKLCRQFLRKAREELNLGHLEEVVCLTKVDTCTDWFNDYVVDGAITFLHRRFIYDNTHYPAPNPSMVIIFRKESLRNPDGSLNVRIETPPRSQASIRDKLAAD